MLVNDTTFQSKLLSLGHQVCSDAIFQVQGTSHVHSSTIIIISLDLHTGLGIDSKLVCLLNGTQSRAPNCWTGVGTVLQRITGHCKSSTVQKISCSTTFDNPLLTVTYFFMLAMIHHTKLNQRVTNDWLTETMMKGSFSQQFRVVNTLSSRQDLLSAHKHVVRVG